MRRDDLQAEFAKRFSWPRMKATPPVTETDLRGVEAKLKTSLPRSYIDFATRFGPLFTPDILHKLVAAQEAGRPAPDSFEVQEFFAPTEIMETYRLYVSGGMDDSHIPFAMDCGGSVFGFRREEKAERPDDAAVLFFDHDYCVVRGVSDSFDAWLEAFLLLEA